MADIGDFNYVDFASKAFYRFRNNIVHVGDLPTLTKRYGNTDCFCTYFLFDKGLMDYVKHNRDSVAGYQGPCHAHFLPLDIDSPDLNQALGTAREITRYLVDSLGIAEDTLVVYYSGMKGFHINLPTGVFGKIEPGPELPKVFSEVRRSVVQRAKVTHPDAVDFGISDRLRLLRLPNTRHSKSSLYKVPVRLEELLCYEVAKIKDIARRPRMAWLTDESGLVPSYQVEPSPDAVELFERCTEQAEKNSHADLPDPGNFLSNGNLKQALCEAELELYREGVPEGNRSSMCLRLASRFRSSGYAEEEASRMVGSFADRCRPPLDARTARQVVAVAYRANGKGYQFGCGTGKGDPAYTNLVNERCNYKTDRMQCETFRQFYTQLNGKSGKGGG